MSDSTATSDSAATGDEATQIAHVLAERFGETSDSAKAEIARLAAELGSAWVLDVAARAEREIASAGPCTRRRDGQPRTRGGVFFAVAFLVGSEAMARGTLTRRAFQRAFGWRATIRARRAGSRPNAPPSSPAHGPDDA